MINLVAKYIKKEKLINDNEKIVIALSGGVDSMVLLNILIKLNYNVIIGHVNHKKRLDSDIEEEAIIKMAKELNIPCEVHHLSDCENANFHNYAHFERYSFFIDIAKKYNAKCIATAHHQDDNLETILLNIMSGSNLYGYGGISPLLNLEGINIIRPMLCVNKEKIQKYSLENNIVYYEDSTNAKDDYTRNRIRHHIIPLLKQECTDILDKSSSYSTLVKESFAFIRKNSTDYLLKNGNNIDNSSFNDLDIALKKDILCLLLESFDIEKNERIIIKLIEIINSSKSQQDYVLKNNYIFKKRYNISYLEKIQEKSFFEIKLTSINDKYSDDKYNVYFTNTPIIHNANYSAKSIKLCYNDIAFPLTIRNRKREDVIKLPFGHKKIKDLFIDKKITRENRESILLVENNEEILWVIDIAKSESVIKQKNSGNIYLVVEELLL